MICRRVKRYNDVNNIIWFGSYGKNGDGTARFFNENNKHDNYSEEKEAVKDSLTQRLSVIRQELWYNVNYGLPLLENIRSKTTIDMNIAAIIETHPDVLDIIEFESRLIDRRYLAEITVRSKYGDINLSI